MSILLLLGGTGTGGTATARPEVARIWIRSRTRDYGWPVFAWVSCATERGKHPQGTFDIELLASDPVLSQVLLDIADGMDVGLISFDFFYRDFATPLWTGPVSAWRITERRGRRTIRFSCKRHAFEAILKRRLVLSLNGAKADSAALGGLSGPADGAARGLMLNHGLSGSPVTPWSYPVGASRTDFGDWTAIAVNATATSPHTVNIEVADGRNLLEAVLDVADKGDLGFSLAEPTRGDWEITTRVGYQVNDLTNEVILSGRLGGLSEFNGDADLETIENVVKMKGKTGTGGGGYQIDNQVSWSSDATSRGIYGVMEGAYTGPDMSATAMADEAAQALANQANPTVNFEVLAFDTRAIQFGRDYTIGDLVRIREERRGIEENRLCVGARVNWTGRAWAVAGVLGKPLASRDQQQAELPFGRRGGRGAGSRFVSTRG